MTRAYLAFTEKGLALAEKLSAALPGSVARCGHGGPGLVDWTSQQFAQSDALIFVGAVGIAVRAVAPHCRSKVSDPAVVVLDECGRFAVPLLSGHLGGANDLARALAAVCGAVPVITTATDANGIFAVDEWAKHQNCVVLEPERIKLVSGKLLAGQPVSYWSEQPIAGQAPAGITRADVQEEADFARTIFPAGEALHLVPRTGVLGVGCRRGTSAEQLEAAFGAFCGAHGLAPQCITAAASIDLKQNEAGLLAFCAAHGWPVSFYSAAQLQNAPGQFTPSPFVQSVTGVDNVCERAAVLASGGSIRIPKQAGGGVTFALALRPETPDWRGGSMSETVFVVGLGPGGPQFLTAQAQSALTQAEVLCGYTVYLNLVRPYYPDKEYYSTGMTKEIDRCRWALETAQTGRTVALVCSGDAGVYGMASPLLELAEEFPDVTVEVVPGLTAALSGGAVLGAPLAHDFCVISLSDRLTPWEVIERRLACAAVGDFCVALYNPSSKGRPDYLAKAVGILRQNGKGPETVCGLVRNIGRDGQESRVLTLAQLETTPVDMFTTVFIGNSQTKRLHGNMVTPRGYRA